ncbi:MAG: MATE family efflux transporter [Firmicutes bacterium]|nr:MATE family efflux transporter [Bacillota bacterium]
MEKLKQNKMGVYPIPRLLCSVSLPLMISMLVQSLYNIVDGIFVAQYIGSDGVTATTVAYSAQLLMLSVSVGTGVGVNSMLSRSLGKRDFDAVNKAATNGLLLAVIWAAVFMLAGALGANAFIRIFNSDETIVDLGTRYLRICMVGCLGIFLATTGERLLQATGNTLLSMIAQLAGAVTNIVLDPIMIHTMRLGIEGAAIATIIGQFVAAAASLALNAVRNKEIHFQIRGFRPDFGIIGGIYKVGAPTIVMQTMNSFMMMLMLQIMRLSEYGSLAQGFYGIYYKLWTFLYMPVNGLAQGLIPVVGYNYGAKNGRRVWDAFRLTAVVAVAVMALGTLVFHLLGAPLLGLYQATQEQLDFGVRAMGIMSMTFPFAGLTICIGFACSGMGNGVVSMVATIVRELAVLIPLAWAFGRFFGFDATWYAVTVAETAALVYALAALAAQYRKKVKPIL